MICLVYSLNEFPDDLYWSIAVIERASESTDLIIASLEVCLVPPISVNTHKSCVYLALTQDSTVQPLTRKFASGETSPKYSCSYTVMEPRTSCRRSSPVARPCSDSCN